MGGGEGERVTGLEKGLKAAVGQNPLAQARVGGGYLVVISP